jgi:glycosyltransferase involved in cell wall biosynthesis
MILSIVVLTHNEEKHIRDCLASVRDFADELLVLDDSSRDHTADIAREMGARVERRKLDSFPAQRNAAIELARGEWIFFIDADERATPAVGAEIRAASSIQYSVNSEQSVNNNAYVSLATRHSPLAGFWIPRRNIIFGKEIRYTGWSPDYQPRVLRKGRARFDSAREVHELVVWDGEVGYLREPLIHYNYESLAQFREKQIKYSRFEAQVWYAEGKRARRRGFIGQPLREFLRRYISLRGWRDGGHGLLLSALMAYYAFVRQRMLWEMQNQSLGGKIAP